MKLASRRSTWCPVWWKRILYGTRTWCSVSHSQDESGDVQEERIGAVIVYDVAYEVVEGEYRGWKSFVRRQKIGLRHAHKE